MMKACALWALGTMSGTSLDGVDAAMLRTDGREIFEFGQTAYRPYTEAERATLRAALGRWPGEAGVAEAAEVVETAHAELLARFTGADLVGFHGQTLAHDPARRGTHQAGDGAVLSEALGLPVVWDFRSADVGLGGQGAPLAPFFHHALARLTGAEKPVVFLNLGGVGNVTWVDPQIAEPEKPGACVAFDTGPANAPINDYMRLRLGKDRDEAGALAAKGRVDARIVRTFLTHPYFLKVPPKSLDRNEFHSLLKSVRTRTIPNAVATLTACAAAAVAAGFSQFPSPPEAVLVCGGGRHNRTLMKMLAERLSCPVRPVEAAGLNGDMLEAQAFAYLAVRVLNGLPTSCPETTGARVAVGGGQISRPTVPA
ncbi:MAG: anhydro-N-acetylmuramic acid kinase [Paracoccaceae bacterium]